MEIFRPISGYEGLYEVGNLGTIISCEKVVPVGVNGGVDVRARKVLRQFPIEFGHLRVWLSKNGKKKAVLVHRIVAAEWVDNPDNLPIVNHIDSDPANNAASNLEWTTLSGNAAHGVAMGNVSLPKQAGSANSNARLNEAQVVAMRVLFSEISNNAEVGRRFGVSPKTAYDICHRRSWTHVE